jgi:beta-glucosidase
MISPLEGISNRAGAEIDVEYALGCSVHKSIPHIEQDWITAEDGTHGHLNVRYYDDLNLDGEAIYQVKAEGSKQAWFGDKTEHFDPNHFSMSMSGFVHVPASGVYTFELSCIGNARLFIENDCVIDLWEQEETEPGQEQRKTYQLELIKGKPYQLLIEYATLPGVHWRGVKLGCLPPMPEDPIAEAVILAKSSDIAIVVAGLTHEWETEEHDRISMDLPREQNQLIEHVAEANPNTVVVLNAGSPLHMPWIDKVKAVLQMWYIGQESGNALADILFGDVDPSGRLPTTFPKRIQDNPAYINFPGENGKVYYGEGIFVGYRYYDKKEIEPLFPFGHGLSYTTFEYDNLRLSADEFSPGAKIQVQVNVTNTGGRSGQEVIQLYLRDLHSSLIRPPKELKAFEKITLDPGETQTVLLSLQEDDLAFYDDAQKTWVIEPGEFEVLIGRSAGDIQISGSFNWRAN